MNYKAKKIKDQIASCTPEELKSFQSNVKNICFACGEKFKNSLYWYFVKGNCCSKCGGEADRNIKGRQKIKKEK